MTTKASISYTKFKFEKMIQFYLEEKVQVFQKKFIN